LCHSVRAFAISTKEADWFFGRWDARRHNGSRNHIIELLMSGYSAGSLFVDDRKHQPAFHSGKWEGLQGSDPDEYNRHTYRLIVQSEAT